jgi:hypothetical protein
VLARAPSRQPTHPHVHSFPDAIDFPAHVPDLSLGERACVQRDTHIDRRVSRRRLRSGLERSEPGHEDKTEP